MSLRVCVFERKCHAMAEEPASIRVAGNNLKPWTQTTADISSSLEIDAQISHLELALFPWLGSCGAGGTW